MPDMPPYWEEAVVKLPLDHENCLEPELASEAVEPLKV